MQTRSLALWAVITAFCMSANSFAQEAPGGYELFSDPPLPGSNDFNSRSEAPGGPNAIHVQHDGWVVAPRPRPLAWRRPGSLLARYQAWWLCYAKPRLQASHWGYADLFHEPPLGMSVYMPLRTQILSGMSARLVLYRYDFCDDLGENAAELNPHGRRRLEDIFRIAQDCELYPIVIEQTPDNPQLDAARKEHVMNLLQQWAFAVPEDSVVVGRPSALGLHGEEALKIHENLMQHVSSGSMAGSMGGPSATAGTGITIGLPTE